MTLIRLVSTFFVLGSSCLLANPVLNAAEMALVSDFKCAHAIKTETPPSGLHGQARSHTLDDFLVESTSDGFIVLSADSSKNWLFYKPQIKNIDSFILGLKLPHRILYARTRSPDFTRIEGVSWNRDQWVPKDDFGIAAYKKNYRELKAQSVDKFKAGVVLQKVIEGELGLLKKDMERNYLVDQKNVEFWTIESRTAQANAKLPDFEKPLDILRRCISSSLSPSIMKIVVDAESSIKAFKTNRSAEESALADMANARALRPMGPEAVQIKAEQYGLVTIKDDYELPGIEERKETQAQARRRLRFVGLDQKTVRSKDIIEIVITRYSDKSDRFEISGPEDLRVKASALLGL